jgi:hypothetical protein
LNPKDATNPVGGFTRSPRAHEWVTGRVTHEDVDALERSTTTAVP